MFARLVVGAALLAVALGGAASSAPSPGNGRAAAISELLQQCQGKEGWDAPAPPVHVFVNVYDVGTCNIEAVLITSKQGHILIDAATNEAGPSIIKNIERLGFRLKDVKVILNTHAHDDHASGIPIVQRATGAAVYLSAGSRPTMEQGRLQADDPQFGIEEPWPKSNVSRTLRDGDFVRVGPLTLTAHLTPGHTYGGTSWTWRSCDANGRCANMVMADSIGAVTNDTYRYGDHPALLASLRKSIDKISAVPCDILLTGHPGASNLYERLSGKAPLVDSQACQVYAANGRKALEGRLAKDRAGK